MLNHQVNRILVVRGGALGDFILSLPVIQTIRINYPECHLAIMGYSHLLPLLHLGYDIAETSSLDQGGLASFFSIDGCLAGRMARYLGSFDLVVSFIPDPGGVFAHNLYRAGAGTVLTIPPVPSSAQREHAIDFFLRALSSLAVKRQIVSPYLDPVQPWERRAGVLWDEWGLDSSSSEVVAIHPGSGSKNKTWSTAKFGLLARRLLEYSNCRILIVAGPADDMAVEFLRGEISDLDPMIFREESIVVLASVLKKCAVFVGNDSGVTHLAAALGLPVAAIFGPTDPSVWGPRGKSVMIVSSDLSCAPCEPEKWRKCLTLQCLERIGVKKVLDAVSSLIGEG